ncbi:hypothetical protein [Cesiribacter sp. SM1]|uniref:hypothetical protein n=1 Tax=Cesiribacter sp. SM1 TaxID=2861196 RepID=UPI001CD65486|nr:hypothetical protein [Cesiribacter sp. SM1]
MDSSISISMLKGLKSSYINVLAFFTQEENSCAYKLQCLVKWGLQLGIHKAELHRYMKDPALIRFQAPNSNINALAQVYDLVYMVYMDGIVEDIELELVSEYASSIGLEAHVVNNLLKAMVAAQMDGTPDEALRSDILVHPEVYV